VTYRRELARSAAPASWAAPQESHIAYIPAFIFVVSCTVRTCCVAVMCLIDYVCLINLVLFIK